MSRLPFASDDVERVVFAPVERPTASIIVVALRRAPYLLDCLAALRDSVARQDYEVIVVLNEPHPSLRAKVAQRLSGALVLPSRANLGFAGAVNLAARRARGEVLVLLNDDAIVTESWLEPLVELLQRRPKAAAVGSKVLLEDGTIQEAGSVIWADGWTFTVGRGLPGTTKRFDYERRVDYCSGCSLAIRRERFLAVGGLDESYYPAYFEEADLCLRLAEAGQEIWYQPRSLVRHRESASTNPMFRQFLLDRNHERFFARWETVLAKREPRVAAHEPAVERAVWRALGSPARLLVVDDRVPERAIGSGFARMADVLAELSASGRYHVALLCSIEDGHLHNGELAALGVEVIDEPLERHLAVVGLGYDLVIISRPHNYERYARRLRELLPEVPIVYDAEALYFRRVERQARFELDPLEAAALEAEAASLERAEAAIAADADAVVCISRDEATFFAKHARGPVEVNAPLLTGLYPTPASFGEREDLGFVAGWFAGGRSPNADGLLWFAREVLPKVRARVPGVRLKVTGALPPENVRRLECAAVEFVGEGDLADFYNGLRMVVVPLRYGAGVKIKTIEALQHGLPTVATSVGAEGIGLDDPTVLPICDDADDFAREVAGLLDDPSAWEERRQAILAQCRRWMEPVAPPTWTALVERLAGTRPRR